MHRFEKLATLICQPYQPPIDAIICDDMDIAENRLTVMWRVGRNYVKLELVSDFVFLEAYIDNQLTCWPSQLFFYTHVRLGLLLEWMNKEGTDEDLDTIRRSPEFYRSYHSDPEFGQYITNGRTDVRVWDAIDLIMPD